MFKMKKMLAALMAATILITSIPMEGRAAELEESSTVETVPEALESEDTIIEEALEPETVTVEESTEQYLIQYLMIEQGNVTLGNTQQIVIGLGCEKELEEVVLYYTNQSTGEQFEQLYSKVIDGAVLFEIPFANEEEIGTYQLDAVSFEVEEKIYTEYFEETGIEAVFGVEQNIESEPDAIVVENESEELESDAAIVRIDEEGNTVSEVSLEEAIENVYMEKPAMFGLKRDNTLVVVLDPGHDNTHAGAQYYGLKEEKLNLKIALYCKEKLEEYQGVKVYLTRAEDGKCPHPGTSVTECNKKRVEYASSVGADIFVSLHNNSSLSTTPKGAMVYYPNSNYNAEAGKEGKGLAKKIQEQLVTLGLYDRGITIRNSEDNTEYPDGSLADYYGVIRNSKEAGISAIIVEHAFMSNINDSSQFLSSDAKLKELGSADAKAIASYYGLSKETITVISEKVEVTDLNNIEGTAVMSVKNVAPLEKIQEISFAVWSTADQNDLFWYTIENTGNKDYTAMLRLENHKYNYGKYYVDVYARDITGKKHYIGGTTCTFALPEAKMTVEADSVQKNYSVKIENVPATGVKEVRVAVWSQKDGQNDLLWYTATKKSQGVYFVNVPVSNHKTAGLYYADAYVVGSNQEKKFFAGTRFQVDDISQASVQIEQLNCAKGTFQAVIKDVKAVSGIQKIEVPVWSQSDQSDLKWYVAEKQNNGSYVAYIDIANHNYRYTKYFVDVYATAQNGIKKYVGGKLVNVNFPITDVKVTANSNETIYTFKSEVINAVLKPSQVKVAVWSQKGGQDDLRWYYATKNAEGLYTVPIPIKNHKTDGMYYADMYVVTQNQMQYAAGGTRFHVTKPSVEQIEIKNKNDGAGTFEVVFSGISSKSGVENIKVAMWSQSDQSDLHWYLTERKADGSYITKVNIANHKYNYGKYYVDAYMTAGNGIYQYVGGKTPIVYMPKARVSATGNASQTRYTLNVADVGVQGGAKNVKIAVWSAKNGQDDLKWYSAKNLGNGQWSAEAAISNHKTDGLYYADAYATDGNGKSVFLDGTRFTVDGPKVSSVQLTKFNEADGTFSIRVKGIESLSGISEVQVAVWSAANQSDLVWYRATKLFNGEYQIGADVRNHQNNLGTYYADVYVTDANGIKAYGGGITCKFLNVSNLLYPIMGSTSVSVEQLMAYYNTRTSYPAFYSKSDAPTLRDFCRIYVEECDAEGIKAEVAFCQAMKETNFLRYGGIVSIEQYNFAGIGSLGGGVNGHSFSTVREGIRAQIQHLKAYASNEPLNNPCVDPRFKYVERGTAMYTEWLGINENPYGKGWALTKDYGHQIVQMIKVLKQ